MKKDSDTENNGYKNNRNAAIGPENCSVYISFRCTTEQAEKLDNAAQSYAQGLNKDRNPGKKKASRSRGSFLRTLIDGI